MWRVSCNCRVGDECRCPMLEGAVAEVERLTKEVQLCGFYQQELADALIAAGFRHPGDRALFNYDFHAASERAKAKLAAMLKEYPR